MSSCLIISISHIDTFFITYGPCIYQFAIYTVTGISNQITVSVRALSIIAQRDVENRIRRVLRKIYRPGIHCPAGRIHLTGKNHTKGIKPVITGFTDIQHSIYFAVSLDIRYLNRCTFVYQYDNFVEIFCRIINQVILYIIQLTGMHSSIS